MAAGSQRQRFSRSTLGGFLTPRWKTVLLKSRKAWVPVVPTVAAVAKIYAASSTTVSPGVGGQFNPFAHSCSGARHVADGQAGPFRPRLTGVELEVLASAWRSPKATLGLSGISPYAGAKSQGSEYPAVVIPVPHTELRNTKRLRTARVASCA